MSLFWSPVPNSSFWSPTDVFPLEFQERLHKEVIDKPPKFSKELLEWRRRQHMLARQKNYAEAQKIKRIADVMEERERKSLDEMNRQQFARRETKFRAEQQAELQVSEKDSNKDSLVQLLL